MSVTIKFDQIASPVSEHYAPGQIVVASFLNFETGAGKVVSVNDDTQEVTFEEATKEEATSRIDKVLAHLPRSFKIYAQNPEHYDDQGIYLKAEGESHPWQTETDAEEFDGIHNPSEIGWSVRDQASAKRWYVEVWGGSPDDDIEFEVYPS